MFTYERLDRYTNDDENIWIISNFKIGDIVIYNGLHQPTLGKRGVLIKPDDNLHIFLVKPLSKDFFETYNKCYAAVYFPEYYAFAIWPKFLIKATEYIEF